MSLRALLIAVILLASGIAVVQTLNLSTTVRAVLSVAAALLAAMTLFLLVKNFRKNRIGRTDTDAASSGSAEAAQSAVGAVNSSGLTLGVVAIGVASFAATNVLGPIINRYFPESASMWTTFLTAVLSTLSTNGRS
ncbi:hypothetical protein [Nonomuraea sp. WAC 01424]|uniref:hypothetical protein n=1 Tax=Nonomuraea sp. WAC 01424 TaxID=2203200 RepID=UPI000F77D981|nr:hypothetical protein [Nonomuraea sp. WAC 01424]